MAPKPNVSNSEPEMYLDMPHYTGHSENGNTIAGSKVRGGGVRIGGRVVLRDFQLAHKLRNEVQPVSRAVECRVNTPLRPITDEGKKDIGSGLARARQ